MAGCTRQSKMSKKIQTCVLLDETVMKTGASWFLAHAGACPEPVEGSSAAITKLRLRRAKRTAQGAFLHQELVEFCGLRNSQQVKCQGGHSGCFATGSGAVG